MPELPEVETVVRQLNPVLCGTKLLRLRVNDPRLALPRNPVRSGSELSRVMRLGKQIVLGFRKEKRGKENYLAIHLRMSGRLLWFERGVRHPDFKSSHIRAIFSFDQGDLLFVDPRRFGTITCGTLEELLPRGIDPLTPEFTRSSFRELLQPSTQSIKPWLLRQDRLVGIGNIYACEILFAAKISPFRVAGAIGGTQSTSLHRCIRNVLNKAVENCGTTFSDFQDSHGELGKYQHFLKVYHREGEKCRRCSETIQRVKQQGRSTFYCPVCQFIPEEKSDRDN